MCFRLIQISYLSDSVDKTWQVLRNATARRRKIFKVKSVDSTSFLHKRKQSHCEAKDLRLWIPTDCLYHAVKWKLWFSETKIERFYDFRDFKNLLTGRKVNIYLLAFGRHLRGVKIFRQDHRSVWQTLSSESSKESRKMVAQNDNITHVLDADHQRKWLVCVILDTDIQQFTTRR